MVDLFGVHAFDEAKIVGHLGGMGHQGTDCGSGLTVFCEGFDGVEKLSLAGGGGHRREAFPFHVGGRDRLAVKLGQLGFVIEKFEVAGSSVLEKVNHSFGFRGDGAGGGKDLIFGGRRIRGEKMGEGGDAKTGSRFSKEVASIGQELGFEKRVHGLFVGEGFVGVQ